ncbi:MAG: hypothetical protein DRP67_05020 [Candidatus Omnitrophota bacterium]|nr:MAG: hypothetical protein DRP67_05020 [Candidatus Omnitrophota bacterium]
MDLTKLMVIFGFCIAFILFIISDWLFLINRKKGAVAFILSLIYLFFIGYYSYLVFYLKPAHIVKTSEKIEKISEEEKSSVSLVIEVDNHKIVVPSGDEIEVDKEAKIRIKRVLTNFPVKNPKANFIGFVGNKRFNDGQDIGYLITYRKILKEKAIGKKDRFRIDIKDGKKKLGEIYINFVD